MDNNNSVEEWKVIDISHGFYEVSSMGQVRRIGAKRCLTPSFRIFSKEVTPKLRARLHLLSGNADVMVSMLVARHFILNTSSCKYLKYKDGNYKNCSRDNLEWTNSSFRAPNRTKAEKNGSLSALSFGILCPRCGEKSVFRNSKKHYYCCACRHTSIN